MWDDYSALIDSIVAAREKAGMTQSQLAKATGLTQSAIARLECKKTIPQLNTLFKVLAPLGYTLAITSSM